MQARAYDQYFNGRSKSADINGTAVEPAPDVAITSGAAFTDERAAKPGFTTILTRNYSRQV